MPLYEYICEEDGSKVELLRPMAQADAPVTDPAGKGRTFKRAQSTFASSAGKSGKPGSLPIGGGCACGRPHGCGSH